MRIALLILVPLFILGIALAGDHILVERLIILTGLLLLSGFLIASLGLWGLKGFIKIPLRHPRAGEIFPVEAATENRAFWPKAFIRLLLKTSHPSGSADIVINAPALRTGLWQHRLSFPRRGYHTIGPLIAEATDPFGLFRLRRRMDAGKKVLIYPAVVELPQFNAEFDADSGILRNRATTQEADGVISGIRDYVPGDSLSRIHWRSSAHTAKLIVKEFDADLSEKIWVVPDMSSIPDSGTGADTIEEYIITIAASITMKYSGTGRQVGLIAQNRDYHLFLPKQGNAHLERIMETLALAKADGQAPLYRLLDKVYSQSSGNSIAIVVTASGDNRLMDIFLKIKKRGIGLAVVMVDASGFGGRLFPEQTAARLTSLNIPIYRVRRGDSLAAALNSQAKSQKSVNGTGFGAG
ncbi:MAG: DUF58 domain-containing protein [Dehalococcoidales bacterium]|nr:DUF58 domain-containing protein [Dehalococcoidales bacterium]